MKNTMKNTIIYTRSCRVLGRETVGRGFSGFSATAAAWARIKTKPCKGTEQKPVWQRTHHKDVAGGAERSASAAYPKTSKTRVSLCLPLHCCIPQLPCQMTPLTCSSHRLSRTLRTQKRTVTALLEVIRNKNRKKKKKKKNLLELPHRNCSPKGALSSSPGFLSG